MQRQPKACTSDLGDYQSRYMCVFWCYVGALTAISLIHTQSRFTAHILF